MDKVKQAKLFADLLQEAMDDVNASPSAGPRAKPARACGCVDKCGDVSKHDENTVLEGIILDPEDRVYEDSMLQDHIQFSGWRSKFADL
jgi:hypothetical protein